MIDKVLHRGSACKLIRNKWKRPLQKKKKVDRYNAFRKYKK